MAKKAAPKKPVSKNTRGKAIPKRTQYHAPGDWRHVVLKLALWAALIIAGLTILTLLFFAIDLPSIDKPKELGRRPALTFLAADGSVLTHTGQSQGTFYDVKDLPPYVGQAVIATEDKRFYHHWGVDPVGILRAMFRNAAGGELIQGGSTITQQLAKNAFLSPDRNLKRKIQEAMLAVWLEHKYSKDEILSAYLNRVYMGAGTYGVDAATQRYFHKDAPHLSLREAATIAGLLKAPNYFSPLNAPARAADRANVVLGLMADQHYISAKTAKQAENTPPPPARKPGNGNALYYATDYATSEAEDIIGEISQDLTIQTTIDARLERAADEAIANTLNNAGDKNVSQGALVAIAPDGAIHAIIGGRNYAESQYNRATQGVRQPGSSFKPIVYLAALEAGMTPYTTVEDGPLTIGSWSPGNYDGDYEGPVTLSTALAKSLNTATIRVLQQVGVNRAINVARRLGITAPLDSNLSLALGTSVVSPLEMTTAYNTIAQLGQYQANYIVSSIKDAKGKSLYKHVPLDGPQKFDKGKVADLTRMMEGVIQYGTGTGAAIGRPAAGKTGTTQDFHDAWFMGFTADLTAGVWLGNDDNKPMKHVTGGSLPAKTWADFMKRALANVPAHDLAAHSFASGDSDGSVAPESIEWNGPRYPTGTLQVPEGKD